MQINKYLDNLPPDVVLDGLFCVTKPGDKQPYDPIKCYSISAKDTFYTMEELIVADIDKYETIGLRAGRGISIIDIDHCVDKKSGEMNAVATEIIDFMKSYTEISPSGTGIRILFKTKTPFDIKDYKTKNSTVGLEYYDADDQESRGGRMARLTGDKIMPYPYREVDTQTLLDKYMVRKKYDLTTLLDEPINHDWVEIVYVLVTHRLDLKNLMNREIEIDESSIDLLLCNAIAEYTTNVGEIKEVFEKTRYYKTKGELSSKKKHKTKWDGDYGWNTVMMSNPKTTRMTCRPSKKKISVKQIVKAAIKNGITKAYYYRTSKIDWADVRLSEQDEVNAMLEIITLKRRKVNVKEFLTEELKRKKA
jgi:hypothetical protein